MSIESYLQEAASRIIDQVETEVDIITFCEHPYYLDQPLHGVEKFILKIFYGLALDNIEKTLTIRSFPYDAVGKKFTEVEYAQFLISQGRTNLLNPFEYKAVTELILVCGRRSGKTFIASIISSFEAYKLIMKRDPQKYYRLPKGEIVRIVNVASASDQALVLSQATQNRILNSKWFEPYVEGKNQSEIRLRTKNDLELLRNEIEIHGKALDNHASIRIEASACSSRAIRGGTVIVCIFDELAHFIDNEGNRSGDSIYQALTPSVATFGLEGKIIDISSPFVKTGVFFDLYNISLEKEEQNKRMFQIPTWEMNEIINFDFLENERKRIPEAFPIEYGAEFTSVISGFFKYPEKIDDCVVREDEIFNPKSHSHAHYIAVDPSSLHDGYALAMVHVEDREEIKSENGKETKVKTKVVVLDKWKVWRLGDPEFEGSQYIDQEIIEEYIQSLAIKFRIVKIAYDQFESSSSVNKFKKLGLNAIKTPFSRSYNMKIFYNLRNLIYEKRLELYREQLGIMELKNLQERKVGKKQFVVEAPLNGPITTDDLADVLANASYIAVEDQIEKRAASIVGTNGVESYSSRGSSINSFQSYYRKLRSNHYDSNIMRAKKLGATK